MNLNYTYQSPSEVRITGYTPEEIMKIPLEKQVTPESLEKGVNILFAELAREFSGDPIDPHRSIVFEIESYRKDGGTVWLEETCTFNRDENGRPTGILLSGRNITERKKAEQERDKLAAQLLHSQKMETVGRLAGGVAHDFNNMLNVILGYIDLAKMRLTMENPIYSDLIEIEKAATRSRDLTAQLLAFSRKQIISPKVVNLNDLVSETQKTITRLIGEDIDLKFYPANELWAIKFDPIQIEQILINLAINARDAMNKGGKLVIETNNINVDSIFCDEHIEIVPGDYVQLTVSDTGSGIDRANLPYVFEPFFTTKEFGKGTGLGLATVYGIVKQNNGFISVYSETGHGSTFKIYLPRTTEAQTIVQKAPEPPAKSGSGTILLVEDDEMVLKMVSDMLEALGYMVIASENPLDALSLCEKGVTPIDLVVTDVVMPQMSGKELRDKLIAHNPDMKILFMSGYTSNIIAQHGVLEEGMQFIQKPFSINLLAEKVKQMLAAK
jgi:PAS domain S-box-containing protein